MQRIFVALPDFFILKTDVVNALLALWDHLDQGRLRAFMLAIVTIFGGPDSLEHRDTTGVSKYSVLVDVARLVVRRRDRGHRELRLRLTDQPVVASPEMCGKRLVLVGMLRVVHQSGARRGVVGDGVGRCIEQCVADAAVAVALIGDRLDGGLRHAKEVECGRLRGRAARVLDDSHLFE